MNNSDRQEARAQSAEYLNLNEQLMVKLASLSASVDQGFRRLDEKMNRFQTDLHDSQIVTNDRINKLASETSERFTLKRARLDAQDDRLNRIETWQAVAMAKVSALVAASAIVLTLFAPAIRHALGVPG
jgi:hypothetical protein